MKREGVRRLGIAVGIVTTVIAFFLIGSEAPQLSDLPLAFVGAAVIGLAALGAVHLVAWVVGGFSSPR
jgi:hypothetical protein